jgi:hypothetical protein
MHRKLEPLLGELHAHTTWSDGSLDLREVVAPDDRNGFAVLAVTDHVNLTHDRWLPTWSPPRVVRAGSHPSLPLRLPPRRCCHTPRLLATESAICAPRARPFCGGSRLLRCAPPPEESPPFHAAAAEP